MRKLKCFITIILLVCMLSSCTANEVNDLESESSSQSENSETVIDNVNSESDTVIDTSSEETENLPETVSSQVESSKVPVSSMQSKPAVSSNTISSSPTSQPGVSSQSVSSEAMVSSTKPLPEMTDEEFTDYLLAKCPQDKSVFDLLSKKYSGADARKIIEFEGSIQELNAQYPIDCIRSKYSAVIYWVADPFDFKNQSDDILLVKSFDSGTGQVSSNAFPYVRSQYTKAEFEAFLSTPKTEGAVFEWDSNGTYEMFAEDGSPASLHCTFDGYYVDILYESGPYNGGTRLVKNVSITLF